MPPPTGQRFVPNDDSSKPPFVYVLVDQEDYSDEDLGYHCYESEELNNIARDDDNQPHAFPQGNPDAPTREVLLELEMEFKTIKTFQGAVRKFNIHLGRNIFFQGWILKDARPSGTNPMPDLNSFLFIRVYVCLDACKQELLQDDIGDHRVNGWNFMSDMQKADCSCCHVVDSMLDENSSADCIFWAAFHTNKFTVICTRVLFRLFKRKPIGRPTLKRNTSRDGPRINPDLHKAKRRYGPITCKYCFKTRHNSRGCDKKKEAMGRGDAGTSGARVQGQETNPEGRRADLDEDATREQEVFREETLEEALLVQSRMRYMEAEDTSAPLPTAPQPTQVRPPRPKKKAPKKNLKRPPPLHPSPLRPHQPEDAPNRNTNGSNQPHIHHQL
ncbi:hypothetical protein PIB30_072790 [Stylosanthes scabra]|uniref:Uncharacterized protein n=1 Tax=Stylosanthes scabra TaxID=79078 RepID=A0ABU6UP35_9FABA|nr:hypothetical protein [Stylosanthes scabra]